MRVVACALVFGVCMFLGVPANAGPPRVFALDDDALLCWRDGQAVSEALSLGTGVRLSYASLVDVRVVTIARLLVDGKPLASVRPVSRLGKAELSECKVGWQAPMVPAAEGAERAVVALVPDRQPFLGTIRAAVRKPGLTLTHLLQVDLDGDGVAEVAFEGSFRAKPSSDYISQRSEAGPAPRWASNSVAGIATADGKRVLLHAVGEDQPSAPGASLVGVTDVEGDGRFELVLGLRGNHWASFMFVGVADGAAKSKAETTLSW
jgi:hypothetical protein